MGELDRAAICARIKQAREEAGLTQPELGEAMEPPVHWRTVQTWESVKTPRVPWDRLDEIATITARSKEWLLHGDQQRETDAEILSVLSDLSDALARRHDEVTGRLDQVESTLRTLSLGAEEAPRSRE